LALWFTYQQVLKESNYIIIYCHFFDIFCRCNVSYGHLFSVWAVRFLSFALSFFLLFGLLFLCNFRKEWESVRTSPTSYMYIFSMFGDFLAFSVIYLVIFSSFPLFWSLAFAAEPEDLTQKHVKSNWHIIEMTQPHDTNMITYDNKVTKHQKANLFSIFPDSDLGNS
jgi:hypothetical protein